MPSYDIVIKQGDTASNFQLQMKDINGDPADLTDGDPSEVQTITFYMKPKSSSYFSYESDDVTFTDLSQGIVSVDTTDSLTNIAAGEYEAILVVEYDGTNVKETFPKFGSYNIFIDSDLIQNNGELPDYEPVLATYADVKNITGQTVSPAILQQAEIIIEQAISRTYEELEEDGLTESDSKWLRNAIAYQAAWLASQVTPYSISDVSAIGSGTAQVELNDTALIRSRFVRDALSKISWLQPNQTLVIDPYRARRSGFYDDEAGVWTTPWRPLRGV